MALTVTEVNTIRANAKAYDLVAPPGYWASDAITLTQSTGGCGAESARVDLVPDTVYGLCIRPACNIHDYDYGKGETLADKIQADSLFLYNMNRIIEAEGGALVWFRKRRAFKYFLAVKYKGHKAFFNHASENFT